jgi:hypothetical protein
MLRRPPLRPPGSAPWPARPAPRRPGGRFSAPHGASPSISATCRPHRPHNPDRRPGASRGGRASCPRARARPRPGSIQACELPEIVRTRTSQCKLYCKIRRTQVDSQFFSGNLPDHTDRADRVAGADPAGGTGREPTETAARRADAMPGRSGPRPAIASLPWSCARRMEPAPIAVGGGPARRMSRPPLAAAIQTAGSAPPAGVAAVTNRTSPQSTGGSAPRPPRGSAACPARAS